MRSAGAVHVHARGRAPRAARTARARGPQARLAPVIDCLHQVYQRSAQGAREARRARLRGARGQGPGRRRGQADRDPRVSAQRRAPPDRGMHDRGQRAGRRLPQEAQAARAVPHPRQAGRGAHRGAEAVPFDARRAPRDRRRPEARAAAEGAGRNLRTAGRALCSRTRSSARCRRRSTSRSTSATSASRSRSMPTSRRRSGATRTCSCIAGSATRLPAGMQRTSCTRRARWRRSARNARLRERRADEAARSVVAWLKCEYMRPRVGEEFDAVVTGVTDFGAVRAAEGNAGRRPRARHRAAGGLFPLPRARPHAGRRAHAACASRSATSCACGSCGWIPTERKIDFEHVAKTGTHHHPRRRAGKAPARHK